MRDRQGGLMGDGAEGIAGGIPLAPGLMDA